VALAHALEEGEETRGANLLVRGCVEKVSVHACDVASGPEKLKP